MEHKEIKAIVISAVVFLVINLMLAAIIGLAGGIATKADIQLVRNDIKHLQSTIERLETAQTKNRDRLVTHIQNHK